ncbi:DNA polymerase eta [Anthonomus grandis grandis]|uniref:DNA polymerase eta n=1 Tax=Anthonomus grandis grandis TaxID=2921223 RepID=UPI0021667FA4|nr:DNA polymerase eta [Anthonomus grandis grandis]
MSHTNRVILLIDMDCFYCQVEENLNPDWKGKPLAVVQYNQWRGGGIIAVNYPARDKGVTRHMRGDDAKAKCPEIILAIVPNSRGKADLSKYRDAGKRVADVLQTFTTNLERASVDEAYLDITSLVEKRIEEKNDDITVDKLPNSFVVGNLTEDFIENVTRDKYLNESNFRLALGGVIAEEIRAEVFRVTGYRCSAGVAHNKILAKLVCGLNKPNKQTILPHEAVPELYKDLPLKKIKSLGGKFGDSIVSKLGIEFMGQLAQFTLKELTKVFDDKNAHWLYNISKGIDTEPVCSRLVSKSIGCSKKFPGKGLTSKEDIDHWLNELAEELCERLEKDFHENGRKGRQMVLTYQQESGDGSKSHPLSCYEKSKIVDNAWRILQKNCMQDDGSYKLFLLGISVGNFQDVSKIKEITSFFKNMVNNKNKMAATNNIIDRTQVEVNHIDDDIYFKTTDEELSPDDRNVTFFEQIYPESVKNQNYNFTSPLMTPEEDSKSNDSISNEISQDTRGESPVLLSPPVNSFFRKYFSGNVNRDFNTSKNLEVKGQCSSKEVIDSLEVNDRCSSKQEVIDSFEVKDQCSTDNPCNTSDDASTEESNVLLQEETINDYSPEKDNKCPQCGKMINPHDYQSHLDYHFALSIVKNEAHLYKNETLTPQAESKKRKTQSETEKHKNKVQKQLNTKNSPPIKPINNYFKPQDEEGTLCTECNMKIRESDWDVHQDFHAAKRLHLEMNVGQKSQSSGNQSKAVKKGSINHKENIKKSSLVKGQGNMLRFLKPT